MPSRTDACKLFAPPCIAARLRDGRGSVTEALLDLARLLGRHAAREVLAGADTTDAVSVDE